MPILVPILDYADSCFTLVIVQGFQLPHVEVTNQDPAAVAVYKLECVIQRDNILVELEKYILYHN